MSTLALVSIVNVNIHPDDASDRLRSRAKTRNELPIVDDPSAHREPSTVFTVEIDRKSRPENGAYTHVFSIYEPAEVGKSLVDTGQAMIIASDATKKIVSLAAKGARFHEINIVGHGVICDAQPAATKRYV